MENVEQIRDINEVDVDKAWQDFKSQLTMFVIALCSAGALAMLSFVYTYLIYVTIFAILIVALNALVCAACLISFIRLKVKAA